MAFLMLLSFNLQSSRTMAPTGKPANTATASAPGMPSAPTTPLAIAATASLGFMETGSTAWQKVIDRLGGCGYIVDTCLFLSR